MLRPDPSLFRPLFYLAVCGLTLVSLLGLASEWGRYLDLLSHFRAHYLLASLILAGLAILGKERLGTVLAFGLLLLNALWVAPWYFREPSSTRTQGSDANQEIRILLSNVLTTNSQHELLLSLVESRAFDLLLFQETGKKWVEQLNSLEATYPHRIVVPREDNFGIAIYSRYPLAQGREIHHPPLGLPSLMAEVQDPRGHYTLINTHPPPPVSESYYRSRNQQFDEIAEWVRDAPGPVLLGGDLNSTVWSAAYRGLERKSGLVNVRRGRGLLPTWPAPWARWGIAIDHVLVSSEFRVIDVTTGPDIGSDHLPLLVDLSLASSP